MHPLQFYRIDNGFLDEKERYYDSLTSLLHSGILNFCGCGRPEDNLAFVHDLLTMYEQRGDKSKQISHEDWDKFYQDSQKKLKEFVHENWDAFVYFFWYVMSGKEIMDHGGSIPGWICDDNFMDALKVWKKGYYLESD